MKRYSELYVERGPRLDDSLRARRRLASWCTQNCKVPDLHARLRTELGLDFRGLYYTSEIRRFFEEACIKDVLDAVTIVFETMYEGPLRQSSGQWLEFVARVFIEENLAYRIERAVVHPFVDKEFDVNRSAALAALDDAKFGEARRDFEDAFRHLRNAEGKAALRSIFPAVETAAKVLFPGRFTRLGPTEVDRHIQPALNACYADNPPAIDAGRRMLAGMKEWINAAQQYRHGQEQQEPAEPPQGFVIMHLSAGAAYLRWMIEICS